MDTAAGRPKVEFRAAAVDLGLQGAPADLSLDGHGDVGLDVPAARMGVDVHGHVRRQADRDASARGRQLATRARLGAEGCGHRAAGGPGPQGAPDVPGRDASARRLGRDLAAEVGDIHAAAARPDVDVEGPGNGDDEPDFQPVPDAIPEPMHAVPLAVPGHVNVVPPLFELELELPEDLFAVAVPDLALDRDLDRTGVGPADLDGPDIRVENELSARFDHERLPDDVLLAPVCHSRHHHRGDDDDDRHEGGAPKHRFSRGHGLLQEGNSHGFTPFIYI
jgi:hypothetical protein